MVWNMDICGIPSKMIACKVCMSVYGRLRTFVNAYLSRYSGWGTVLLYEEVLNLCVTQVVLVLTPHGSMFARRNLNR